MIDNRRILIDCERSKISPSGLQYYNQNLVEGLLPYRTDLILYAPRALYGLPYVKYHPWHKFIPKRTSSYALIHLTYQATEYHPYLSSQPKVLLTIHDLNILHLEHKSAFRRERVLSLLRKHIRRADCIVTISKYVKQDLLEHQHLLPELEGKPIEVIYNGISFEIAQAMHYDRADLPEVLQERRYLINIGQASKKKNQLSLVRMLPLLAEDLVLVVDDPDNAYSRLLKEEAQRLEVSGRLHFFSKVSDEEKHRLLHFAEAMVHPSLAEGFGYPPVECMWHQRPVFLAPLTALPEIGGSVAYYLEGFAPEEMAKVYHQGMADFQAHQKERKTALRERALYFSQERMGREYNALYNKILDK